MEDTELEEGDVYVPVATAEKKRNLMETDKVAEEVEVKSEVLPPPQPTGERDDNWFVLLDVVPREGPYVPPGIAKNPLCCFATHAGWLLLCCC